MCDSSSEESHGRRWNKRPYWRRGGGIGFDLDLDFDFGGGGYLGDSIFIRGRCLTSAGCRLKCSGILEDNAGVCLYRYCVCFRKADICDIIA